MKGTKKVEKVPKDASRHVKNPPLLHEMPFHIDRIKYQARSNSQRVAFCKRNE